MAVTRIEQELQRLNKALDLVNPLLGTWQQTPRGAVFLTDEYEVISDLLSSCTRDFERAYLLKRAGDLTRALEIFSRDESEEALIQMCFIHIAQKDSTSLQRTLLSLRESSMRSYFEAVEYLRSDDTRNGFNSLRDSLDRDPRNVHSLLVSLSYFREAHFTWTLNQDAVWQNPILLQAAAKGLLALGQPDEALSAATTAASSWILQADLYMTLLTAARESGATDVTANVIALARDFGVSEARAAVALAPFLSGDSSTLGMYDPQDIHVVHDSRLAKLGAAITEELGDNLIHDGDASNFNGRYFSRDVSALESFIAYEAVLGELLENLSPHVRSAYNFTWADVSITTNASNILNHLHTAGPEREYLMTAVTYPEVPHGIVEGRTDGTLRIGPTNISGFAFDTWERTVTPSPDIAVFFPSHFFHETAPLSGQKTRRVSINTDFGRVGAGVEEAIAALRSPL